MNTLRISSTLVIALAGLTVSSACNDDNNDIVVTDAGTRDSGDGEADASTDAGSLADAGPVQSDEEIAAIVSTVNAGEIAQGNVARTKAEDRSVRDFAQQMVTEHTAVERRFTQLLDREGINPAPSALSRQLQTESENLVQQLDAAPAGPEFDRTYIDSQVEVHQKVLDLLQDELIPAAQNRTVRAELDAISKAVEKHRDEAERIASDLGTSGGDGGIQVDAGAVDAGAGAGADGGLRDDGGIGTGTSDGGTTPR